MSNQEAQETGQVTRDTLWTDARDAVLAGFVNRALARTDESNVAI